MPHPSDLSPCLFARTRGLQRRVFALLGLLLGLCGLLGMGAARAADDFLDPEQAFKVRMAAGDLSAFVAGLGAAARAKAIEEDISPFPGRAKPAYRKPAWWNAPPLAGPVAVVYRITSRGHTSSDTDYLLLYEPVGDVLYVVWGRS